MTVDDAIDGEREKPATPCRVSRADSVGRTAVCVAAVEIGTSLSCAIGLGILMLVASLRRDGRSSGAELPARSAGTQEVYDEAERLCHARALGLARQPPLPRDDDLR